MMSELKDYEINFLKYYRNKYNIAFIKVKQAIRHKPTYYGVTVKTMFQWLEANKIYEVIDLINEGK